jgi:P4 family phage/plasmid primase-like protien
MNDINKMIESSIKMPTVYDIATVLHRMFKYDYKYSPQGTWYYFDNHLWRENNDGIMLRNKISTDLCDKYAQMIQSYNNHMLENKELTDEDKEDLKTRKKEILSIVAKLRTTSFKDNIIRECRELFYDIDFLNKLDENFYLIGFQNGIYDLKRMEMREGRPDDYVTLTTRINKIEFTEEHEHWPELSKFIYTIFPKEEKRHYFMTFLSSCLQGLNAEEKFRVWTGTGCHAMDTPIMMADGSWKMVQDIVPGEQLMGDDSTPRNVLELFRGHSSMYRISGAGFESFVVNGDHILCLTDFEGIVSEISVKDYLNNAANYSRRRRRLRMYKRDGSVYDFQIEYVKEDDFYGFQLDGNHRYVMADNIITHNSNGKSKLEELFTASFGDYTIKFPITLLTGKRAASNACSPELVKAKGKRIGYFVEPSEGERVNAGLMKEFTGGDKIYARGLNKDPIEFKPQFKLSLLCNDVPHFPPKDTGVWRRVEIVEFESKFVDSPNPENPNEFPIDKQVTEKIQHWKELFMAYLIDVYYAQYKVTGMRVPDEVLKFTIEYQKMFDMYSEFISRVIVETGVMSDTVTLSELHEEFKNWFLEMYNSPKVPTKHEFRQYMEKTYGKKRVTPMEVKGIKTKMKIEEERKKKEAEEKAQLVKEDDPLPGGGMIENDDEEDEGGVEDEDAEFLRLMSGSGKGAAADEDEPDFEEEFERHLREGTLDRSTSVSKYFTDMPKSKSKSNTTSSRESSTSLAPKGAGSSRESSTMVTRNGSAGAGASPGSMTTTTTTTTSYVNGKLVQGGASNPFASFPPIPGMPGGGDPFANFPKPPGFVQNPGQNQVTTTNNEYNITSMNDLENLKIPGMDVNDNPVLKALFRKDMESIEELRRVEYKQTGPTSYQLPTITLPPEKKVETYVDEHGNRTTTTTINTTNNIPTINFDGLPEGFTGNPFKLLADKMEEKIMRSRRPPPPPPMHLVASAILSSILSKKVMEEEEKRRQQREERGEPEPSEEEKMRQAEEDEERFRSMLESGEMDVDIPPDHPMLVAFGQMMRDMMRHDIEQKVRSDPNIPPEKVEEVLRDIFEEEERDRRDREMNMPESGIMFRRRPETPPNFFRRGFMMDDEEEKEKTQKITISKPKPEYPADMPEEERDYLEYMRENGIEPIELSEEELAYEMARADAIEREADEELARLEMEREELLRKRKKEKEAAAAAAATPLMVEEVVEEDKKKKSTKKKVTVSVKKSKE